MKSPIKIPYKTYIGNLFPKLINYHLEKFTYINKLEILIPKTYSNFKIKDYKINVETYHYNEKNINNCYNDWFSNVLCRKNNGEYYLEELFISEDWSINMKRNIQYKLEKNNENLVLINLEEDISSLKYLNIDYYEKNYLEIIK
jgi:hypothetical protein